MQIIMMFGLFILFFQSLEGYTWRDIWTLIPKIDKNNSCTPQSGYFDADLVASLGWLPLVSLMIYVVAFSIGMKKVLE
jgi:hypothetical protein